MKLFFVAGFWCQPDYYQNAQNDVWDDAIAFFHNHGRVDMPSFYPEGQNLGFFSGMFATDDNGNVIPGESMIEDKSGPAFLMEGKIDFGSGVFDFVKQYPNRTDCIVYNLVREVFQGIFLWKGTFSLVNVGRSEDGSANGFAKMFITPTNPPFLQISP